MVDAGAPGSKEIRLAELLGALSHALDMVEGQPAGHCVRGCWIGVHVGREIGLDEAQIWDLYYVLLMKDLGCSSNAARICRLFLTDDLAFKHDAKTIDGSLPQALRFVLSHTGLKSGLAEQFRTLVDVFLNSGEIGRELVETRCHRGADIARRMRFSESVARDIESLDEHWDGSGLPLGARGEAIPIYSRIALMAQVADVFQVANGPQAARHEINRRAGSWFDPRLAAAFDRIAARPDFWTGLRSDDLQQRVFALEPAQRSTVVDEDYLDDIAGAFAQVVELEKPLHQRPQRTRHRLRRPDRRAARLFAAAATLAQARRAAARHRQARREQRHPRQGGQARPRRMGSDEAARGAYADDFSRIAALGELAAIAGAHHERLDGKGYPRGLTAEQIASETRIITTADIFDALTADRPYRAAMPVSKALAIMADMVGTQVDAQCFDASRWALGNVDGALAA